MRYLAEFAQHGINLWLDGEKIRAAPVSNLTDPLRQVIREHRAEIMQELQVVLTPAPIAPGDRVLVHGDISATVLVAHPADDLFPDGWVEIVTDDGRAGQVDLSCVKKILPEVLDASA